MFFLKKGPWLVPFGAFLGYILGDYVVKATVRRDLQIYRDIEFYKKQGLSRSDRLDDLRKPGLF